RYERRLASGRGPLRVHRREPAVTVGDVTADVVEELLLDALSDRATLAVADWDTVHSTNRSDFRCGAGEEDLIREVEHLPRDQPLDHFVSHVARNLDDARSRDAGE